MYFGLDTDVGSLPPLFGGDLPGVNSDDQIDLIHGFNNYDLYQ